MSPARGDTWPFPRRVNPKTLPWGPSRGPRCRLRVGTGFALLEKNTRIPQSRASWGNTKTKALACFLAP